MSAARRPAPRPGTRIASYIERVPLREPGAANRAIERWKRMQAEGWELTALAAIDGSHMLGLGYRERDA